MLLIVTTVLVGLCSLVGAQAQSIDCSRLVSNCTGVSSAKKFPSPLSCLKKAPAPIQRACATVIANYSQCEKRCDKGTRGNLCRSKCGTASSRGTVKRNKNQRPGAAVKRPKIVKKPGAAVKRTGKAVRAVKGAKAGKLGSDKKSTVKHNGKLKHPRNKAKTG